MSITIFFALLIAALSVITIKLIRLTNEVRELRATVLYVGDVAHCAEILAREMATTRV